MVRPEANARHPEVCAEQGGACPLVAIEKRVVGYDAEGVSARPVDSAWVQVCSTEGLERLR